MRPRRGWHIGWRRTVRGICPRNAVSLSIGCAPANCSGWQVPLRLSWVSIFPGWMRYSWRAGPEPVHPYSADWACRSRGSGCARRAYRWGRSVGYVPGASSAGDFRAERGSYRFRPNEPVCAFAAFVRCRGGAPLRAEELSLFGEHTGALLNRTGAAELSAPQGGRLVLDARGVGDESGGSACTGGGPYQLIDAEDGSLIGTMDSAAGMTQGHPGAIYIPPERPIPSGVLG